MKIVVADDSRVMRQIVIRTLRQAGFAGHDILEAGNGAEAVELVRAEAPDLVLSDWNMPEMNGIDALATLRASGSQVPFGFVTSEGSEDMRARAAAEGALFLIAKPFTPETFAEALAPVLVG
ncbi:MAG: response regulator [Marmoricola sp.]